MGAGASIPDEVDEETARSLAGDKYDQAKFEELAVDGKISKTRWIAAEAKAIPHPNEGGKGLRRFRRASLVVVVANRFAAPIMKKQKPMKRGKGLKVSAGMPNLVHALTIPTSAVGERTGTH
jgi:hypothetical protein